MTTKLRRMLLCLGLVLSMSFLLFGCGPNNQDANATGTPEDTIDESIDESTDVAEGTEVMEESSESTPEIDTDPLAPLMVSEEIAQNYGGIYLYRNGGLYSLNDFASRKQTKEYVIGWASNDQVLATLYRFRKLRGESSVSMGDVPLPTLEEGDEIRGYKNATLGIDVATFDGYSPIMVEGTSDVLIYDNLEDWPIQITAVDSIQIQDRNGNIIPIEDMHNLNYLENYKVTWYENQTEYRELELVANCRCYTSRDRTYSSKADYDYTIEGELTQNGYATFDLSGVDSGIYMIRNMNGGYFEIP